MSVARLYRTITLSLLVQIALSYVLLRILHAHHVDIRGYLADPAKEPSHFFKVWQRGERAYVLRPRKTLYRFTIAGGLAKQYVRTQPILALKEAPLRPAHYGCQKSSEHPLAFIGVFSTASRWNRRVLLRSYEKPASDYVGGARVEFKFILGRPADPAEFRALQHEMERHGDIVLLDQRENMNDGKTHAFYQYLATRAEPMPQFAFKADDDTLVVVPNLVRMLQKQDCSELIYTGSCIDYTCGIDRGYPQYYTGMMYGLSAPLVHWIGNATIPAHRLRGNEDVKTAQFLLNLDSRRENEQLVRLNLDGRLGDWRYNTGKEWQFSPETVLAIHGMKREEALIRVSERLREKPKDLVGKKTNLLRQGYKLFTDRGK